MTDLMSGDEITTADLLERMRRNGPRAPMIAEFLKRFAPHMPLHSQAPNAYIVDKLRGIDGP